MKLCEIPGGGTHILVRCKINSHKAYLLIDTGASQSIFDYNGIQFNKEDIEDVENDGTSSGFNSSIDELYTGKIDSLNISYLRTSIEPAIFTPLDHINNIYSSINLPVISGILGCDFLIKHNATIDFSINKISLDRI